MFQFPSFPAAPYEFGCGCLGIAPGGSAPLGDPRVTACLTAHRGLS